MATAKKSRARKKIARKKAKKKTVKKAARKAAPKKTTKRKAAARKKPARKRVANIAVESRSAAPIQSIEARLLEPLAAIEKALGQLRRNDWLRPSTWEWPDFPTFDAGIPFVDIIDHDKEIVVKAEIPGIDPDDVQVSVSDRTLTIKGESSHAEETEAGDVHRREIRRGSIYRSLTLPADVDGGKARAACKDGIMTLRLPKKRGAKKHSIRPS